MTIDNNVSERRLRDQAIGRKNWLFLGSDEAGPRAAVSCTILAGPKRHRLESWAYLRDVILQRPRCDRTHVHPQGRFRCGRACFRQPTRTPMDRSASIPVL